MKHDFAVYCMKIRTNFVTNSSSSSFVVARRGSLNEKQKQELLKYIEEQFFGRRFVGPQDSKEEKGKKYEELENWYLEEDNLEKAKEEVKNGKTIYIGRIDNEEAEYHLHKIYTSIWDIIRKHDTEKNIVFIDDDLDY